MSLTLCSTPDQLYCAQNVEIKYEECLPQCSGVWIISNDKKEIDDITLTNRIKDLTEQYWKFKDFYEFPKYLSNGIKNPQWSYKETEFDRFYYKI